MANFHYFTIEYKIVLMHDQFNTGRAGLALDTTSFPSSNIIKKNYFSDKLPKTHFSCVKDTCTIFL
jgi:hypothetical protein